MQIEFVRNQFRSFKFMHGQPFFLLAPCQQPNDVGLFVILMHHGIVVHSARNVSPWGGRLLYKIQTDITKEWYIVVASQTYLHACPQVISQCTYLCRSIDLLLNHIKDEEVLEKVLEEEALQAKHIEEEQYALYLLSQIDVYTQSAGAMATDAI
jgi:hypothetical protein